MKVQEAVGTLLAIAGAALLGYQEYRRVNVR